MTSSAFWPGFWRSVLASAGHLPFLCMTTLTTCLVEEQQKDAKRCKKIRKANAQQREKWGECESCWIRNSNIAGSVLARLDGEVGQRANRKLP